MNKYFFFYYRNSLKPTPNRQPPTITNPPPLIKPLLITTSNLILKNIGIYKPWFLNAKGSGWGFEQKIQSKKIEIEPEIDIVLTFW